MLVCETNNTNDLIEGYTTEYSEESSKDLQNNSALDDQHLHPINARNPADTNHKKGTLSSERQ
jgi:hypothetical protein